MDVGQYFLPECLKTEKRLTFDNTQIMDFAWASDGDELVAVTKSGNVFVYDFIEERSYPILQYEGIPLCVSFSPNCRYIAVGGDCGFIVWDHMSQQIAWTHASERIYQVKWNSRGNMLATASDNYSVKIWKNTNLLHDISMIMRDTNSIAWANTSDQLAVSTKSHVAIYDITTESNLLLSNIPADTPDNLVWTDRDSEIIFTDHENSVNIFRFSFKRSQKLQEHEELITGVSIINDKVIVTRSYDDSIKLWNKHSSELMLSFHFPTSSKYTQVAFCPPDYTQLAVTSVDNQAILVFRVDHQCLYQTNRDIDNVYYSNAKIGLVGDSGAGKTGLRNALLDMEYQPVDSTHGREIFTLHTDKMQNENTGATTHIEIILWDMGGQKEFHVQHQLIISDLSVAVIVFDASKDNYKSQIHYWNRFVSVANRQNDQPMKKFLVAARSDTSRKLTPEKMKELAEMINADAYFVTSAKLDQGVKPLYHKLLDSIPWVDLPVARSSAVVRQIRLFIQQLKSRDATLKMIKESDLFSKWLKKSQNVETTELRGIFSQAVKLLSSQGILRKFKWGEFILLQEGIADSYAKQIIEHVENLEEGYMLRHDILNANFDIDPARKLHDKEQEAHLIRAIIEDFIENEVALSEKISNPLLLKDVSEDYIIFPFALTNGDNVASDEFLTGKEVMYTFEGVFLNLYASLVLRLIMSQNTTRHDLGRHSLLLHFGDKGEYGIYIKEVDEISAQLYLRSSDRADNKEFKALDTFIVDYFDSPLTKAENFERIRVYKCSSCKYQFPQGMIDKRRERHPDNAWILCPICEQAKVPIVEEEELRSTIAKLVSHFKQQAESEKVRRQKLETYTHKKELGLFDLFVACNSRDANDVGWILKQLKDRGKYVRVGTRNMNWLEFIRDSKINWLLVHISEHTSRQNLMTYNRLIGRCLSYDIKVVLYDYKKIRRKEFIDYKYQSISQIYYRAPSDIIALDELNELLEEKND